MTSYNMYGIQQKTTFVLFESFDILTFNFAVKWVSKSEHIFY